MLVTQVLENADVAPQSASHRRHHSTRLAFDGIFLVTVGLVLIYAVGLLGGWIVNTPPHAYQPSLAGLGWSVSVPLGVLLVMLGAARLARGEVRLIGSIATATIAVIGWTAWRDILHWPDAQPPSVLFGAGGALMVLFFLGAVWYWAAGRARLSAPKRVVADLRLFGLALILIAAWVVCGLFGSPVFLLRPALAATSPLAEYAVPVAATALVYLTIGFGLTFAASLVEAHSTGKAA